MKKKNIIIGCVFLIYIGLFISYFFFLTLSAIRIINMPLHQYFWQFILSTTLVSILISVIILLLRKKNIIVSIIIIILVISTGIFCLFLWDLEDKLITFTTPDKACKYSGICKNEGNYFEVDEYAIYIYKGQMIYTKKVNERWKSFGNTLYGHRFTSPNNYVTIYEIEDKLLLVSRNNEDTEILYNNKAFEKNNNGVLYILIPRLENFTLNINSEEIEFKVS